MNFYDLLLSLDSLSMTIARYGLNNWPFIKYLQKNVWLCFQPAPRGFKFGCYFGNNKSLAEAICIYQICYGIP